jgi:hypothetical protein
MIAGAVGTATMDVLWYFRYRRGGGKERFVDWEFSRSTKSFDEAGTPAQVGKLLAKSLLNIDLPPEAAATTNNIVHWATGLQWGALYGISAGRTRREQLASGVVLGIVGWLAAYTVLPPAGLYEPIWQYDTETLVEDVSAHLLFGTATAVAFRAFTPR